MAEISRRAVRVRIAVFSILRLDVSVRTAWSNRRALAIGAGLRLLAGRINRHFMRTPIRVETGTAVTASAAATAATSVRIPTGGIFSHSAALPCHCVVSARAVITKFSSIHHAIIVAARDRKSVV